MCFNRVFFSFSLSPPPPALSLHSPLSTILSLPERRPQRRRRVRRGLGRLDAENGVAVVGRSGPRAGREQRRASGVVAAAHAKGLAADVRREEEVAGLLLLLVFWREEIE